eukprot:m.197786 g.197786  ORF g.197786 m.197786 type:complete len:106 (-) comp13685_c0_seq3:5507-5824(-)
MSQCRNIRNGQTISKVQRVHIPKCGNVSDGTTCQELETDVWDPIELLQSCTDYGVDEVLGEVALLSLLFTVTTITVEEKKMNTPLLFLFNFFIVLFCHFLSFFLS